MHAHEQSVTFECIIVRGGHTLMQQRSLLGNQGELRSMRSSDCRQVGVGYA